MKILLEIDYDLDKIAVCICNFEYTNNIVGNHTDWGHIKKLDDATPFEKKQVLKAFEIIKNKIKEKNT